MAGNRVVCSSAMSIYNRYFGCLTMVVAPSRGSDRWAFTRLLGCLFATITLLAGGCDRLATTRPTAKQSPGSAASPESGDQSDDVATTEASATGASATKIAAKPAAGDRASDKRLKDAVDRAIDIARRRYMDPQVNNAWQIVHGILAFGPDLQINVEGKLRPALDFLFQGGETRGWVLMPGSKGLKDVEEPGSKSGEGHDDQWLGYIAQCGIAPETPIKAGGRDFTVTDLVTQAQWDVHEGMEATWTLMAFSVYLPLDAKWRANSGGEWSIERLLAMECGQDLYSSTCGGTHRMYGIACALNRYLDEGGKLEGTWKAADDKIRAAVDAAHEYQQPDGGFSVNFFERSSASPDVNLRINTTGHVFEFLALALSDEELRQPWVTRAAEYLCTLLAATADAPLECGGLYHAVHGLELYRLRRFAR
jgi:hypothetical protein